MDYREVFDMGEKGNKKSGKDKKSPDDNDSAKSDLKKNMPTLVIAGSGDLEEVVTETVTRLLGEDVLEMDDKGVIDIKKPDILKKKKKKDDK